MSIKSFIPPKLNYPLLWFTDFSLPFLFKAIHNLDSVEVSEEDKKVLRDLRKERLVILSNHPTTKEPPVMYTLANIMSSRFHYMASREVFDWGSGFVGEFIQGIGAYSVIAGANDKESLKMTRELLAAPGGKLVLFPEGEPTSGLNDTLLPFQPGISQLSFWGLEEAKKADPDAKLFILPVFIKYRHNQPEETLKKDLDESLQILETKLGITKLGKTIVERFLSVGRRIVEKEEREYGITPEPEQDYNFRLGKLRHTILDNIARKVEIPKYDTKENAVLKLRKILSFLELSTVGVIQAEDKNIQPEVAKWARLAAQKAYDSITFSTDYLTEFPSTERLFEWLYRYEKEILGEAKYRPHLARVRLGSPIPIHKLYQDYKKEKRSVIQSLTEECRKVLENLMQEEIAKTKPLFPEGFRF
jgi:1-acyl-sn-glycerol-3-phosphate acyltransferase